MLTCVQGSTGQQQLSPRMAVATSFATFTPAAQPAAWQQLLRNPAVDLVSASAGSGARQTLPLPRYAGNAAGNRVATVRHAGWQRRCTHPGRCARCSRQHTQKPAGGAKSTALAHRALGTLIREAWVDHFRGDRAGALVGMLLASLMDASAT